MRILSAFSTIFSLIVTLTFDLLTSKSSQYIIVPNCVHRSSKFREIPQGVHDVSCLQADGRTDVRTVNPKS